MMPVRHKFAALPFKLLAILFLAGSLAESMPCFSQAKTDTIYTRPPIADPDTVKVNIPYRFSEYEPNYIVTNFGQNNYGQVKFKISLKFDLNIKSEKNKVYFGITQLAFWDLYEKSAPMKEIDFTPVLFYSHRLSKLYPVGNDWLFKIGDYQIGFLHGSNGQDGNTNRSYYKAFVNSDIDLIRREPQQLKFTLSRIKLTLKAWAWCWVDPENKNIRDYWGYGQLISAFQFDYGIKNKFRPYQMEIYDVFTPAEAGLSNELNLEFNPFIGHLDFDWIPYLHLQFFHGYGEGLLYYNNSNTNYKPINVFRVGVQFRVF
jgi:phospholipase A1/A2